MLKPGGLLRIGGRREGGSIVRAPICSEPWWLQAAGPAGNRALVRALPILQCPANPTLNLEAQAPSSAVLLKFKRGEPLTPLGELQWRTAAQRPIWKLFVRDCDRRLL